MSKEQFRAACLNKLSAAELAQLDAWLLEFATDVIRLSQQTSGNAIWGETRSQYVVEAAVNDETFYHQRRSFQSKTYCFGIKPGDRVIFISGSPFGACASAEFAVVRTGRTCSCWCE